MAGRDHIAVLLGGLDREFAAIENHYRSARSGGVVSEELQLALLDYSVHARAVLDYLIKEIAKRSGGAGRTRLYFPIASLTEPRPAFESRLRGLLPGLHGARPNLFDYLVSLQHYSDGPWMTQLQGLSNESKHEKLATPVLGVVASFVAEYEGAGIAVGDSGDCLTLEIAAGASLGGPGVYDARIASGEMCLTVGRASDLKQGLVKGEGAALLRGAHSGER